MLHLILQGRTIQASACPLLQALLDSNNYHNNGAVIPTCKHNLQYNKIVMFTKAGFLLAKKKKKIFSPSNSKHSLSDSLMDRRNSPDKNASPRDVQMREWPFQCTGKCKETSWKKARTLGRTLHFTGLQVGHCVLRCFSFSIPSLTKCVVDQSLSKAQLFWCLIYIFLRQNTMILLFLANPTKGNQYCTACCEILMGAVKRTAYEYSKVQSSSCYVSFFSKTTMT